MSRALVAVLLLLGLATVARAQGVSPGPLASDHAALEGVDNCIRCHSSGDAISARACLTCHKALDARIAAKAGVHASVGSECASCHPDHRGVRAELVKWPGGRDAFDHKKAGYALDGGHAKVACRDCHKVAFLAGPVAKALTADERPRTFLGLGTTCVTCHVDIHKPTLGTDCQRCHDSAAWRQPATAKVFDHAKTKYPLLGGHAKVDCTKCHGGTDQKLANLHPKFATCNTCHADPHDAAMGAVTACATCHRESTWKDLRYDRASHAPRTLPLVNNAHARPACAACHGAKNDRKPAAACAPCHADPHAPSLGVRCETCHGTTLWTTRTTNKLEFHDRTNYPLRGLHVSVACDKCHDPKLPTARRFRPIAHGKCLDCHADPHHGEADKPCETCHGVDNWKPPHFEIADHAKTKYALEGAHRAVPCAKCHPSPPEAPGFKRGNPACEACHADPHAGQFAGKGNCASCHGVVAWSPSTFTKEAHAKAGLELTGKHDVACGRCHAKQFVDLSKECSSCHADRHAGQLVPQACSACHAGAVWKPAPGFDHAKTFVLRGRHAAADCARCHPDKRIAIANAPVLVTAVYKLGKTARACAGCHRSQHGDPRSGIDQARLLGKATTACEDCHGETTWRETKAPTRFDHVATGAPLVGGHARVACETCHRPDHRALPKLAECTGCHRDRHAGRLGDRCESCHSPATWKADQILVDHQRTRLPLLGAHAVQGCPTCHKNAQAGDYRGLDPTCRGCHQHTVDEIHPHPDHTKDLAFNACENCHSSLGWRPAQLNHDAFWALSGKHLTIACEACHAPGQAFSRAPSQCLGCHAKDLTMGNATTPMHDQYGIECQQCHNATSWKSATFQHPLFPIPHHSTSTCATCHPAQTTPAMFTCGLNSACHPKSTTDNRHNSVGGYAYDSQQCFRCHGGG